MAQFNYKELSALYPHTVIGARIYGKTRINSSLSILNLIRTLTLTAAIGLGLCLCGNASATNILIPDIRDTYGVSIADFDGDHLQDIYFVGYRTLNRLLLNKGDGTFYDQSIPAGVGGNLATQGTRNLELGASAIDFDNDGAVDLLICGWGQSLDLLKNRKDGTFISVTDQIGLKRNVDANMAIWGDLNGDGFLDPLLTNEQGPVRLYENDHGLKLRPVNLDSAGIASDSGTQGALWVDLDLDGDLDLVLAGWLHPLRIYTQVAPFHFQEIELKLALPEGTKCNAVLGGDFDNDGDADLLVTVRQGYNLLLVNQANPARTLEKISTWPILSKPLAFIEQSKSHGLNDSLDTYGGGFGDFDGDGDFDLFLTTRSKPQYYENRNSYFYKRSLPDVGIGAESTHYNTGFMFGELTHGLGDEFVIASKESTCVIVDGPVPISPRVKIILHGVESNRNGIGSEISLWSKSGAKEEWQAPSTSVDKIHPNAGDEQGESSKEKNIIRKVFGALDGKMWNLKQSVQVYGGSGYLSSYLGPTSLFLTDTQKVEQIRVRFPSGKVIVRNVTPQDSVIEVWESGPFSVAYEWVKRTGYSVLRDPTWRIKIELSILFLIIGIGLLRATLKMMASSIARKQVTEKLMQKNLELQNLISELSRTQQQLIRSEKLAALGQLVAGIAHELNNPVGFIYANLFQIRKYLDTISQTHLDSTSKTVAAKMDSALKESQEGAIRIRDIIQNLRILSRADSPGTGFGSVLQKKPCQINTLIEKSILMAQTSFSKNITIEKRLNSIPALEIDESQIHQVMLNILVNAGQALGEEGNIYVTSQVEDNMVTIKIADNGPGILPENQSHLFEPFFTTKPVGQGIGLGLHICYQIITAHHGTIEAHSLGSQSNGEIKCGAEFSIRLPLNLEKNNS